MGYVIECEDKRERFRRGERFQFHLLLFGKTMVYFTQLLQAFYLLGQIGIGKDRARYQIEEVTNGQGECVADSTQAYAGRLGISTIARYVEERRKQIAGTDRKIISFQSPVSIKYHGRFIRQFDAEALFRCILRRIYSFDCFEGIEAPLLELENEMPEIIFQKSYPVSVSRYSSTLDAKMQLRGISGELVFEKLSELQLTGCWRESGCT